MFSDGQSAHPDPGSLEENVQQQTWLMRLLRFGESIVIVVLVITALVGATFFVVGGFSIRAYSNRLFWGGIAAGLIGLLSSLAAAGATRLYKPPRRVPAQTGGQKVVTRRYGLAFRMCIVGMICTGASAVVGMLTR